MFLFGKKSQLFLGLDIGTSAIKLVELEQGEGRYKLKTYGVYPLVEYFKHIEEQLWVEPSKLLDGQIAGTVKQLIKEANVQSKKVCLSIPVYSSFSTLIDLPPMPEKEISRAIPFEAKKYVPVPISEVVLDWSIIEKSAEQKPKVEEGRANSQGVQILLVAVPKAIIAKYAQIIQLAGLELKALEAETFSLARSLVGNDKSPIVVVDIVARSSNISIIDKGYIRIIHNLEKGGAELTRNLSQKLNINFEKAEEMKKIGQDSQLMAREVIYSVLDVIVAEVKKIISHYQIRYSRRIEKCILAGAGATINGLSDYFSSKLGLEISLGNPFARVVYPALLEPAIKELGPSLAVAVGLAMRE